MLCRDNNVLIRLRSRHKDNFVRDKKKFMFWLTWFCRIQDQKHPVWLLQTKLEDVLMAPDGFMLTKCWAVVSPSCHTTTIHLLHDTYCRNTFLICMSYYWQKSKMLTGLLLHSHNPPLLAIQKHCLESCPEALHQLSIHSKYRTTLFSDRWYTHVSEVLLHPSSACSSGPV